MCKAFSVFAFSRLTIGSSLSGLNNKKMRGRKREGERERRVIEEREKRKESESERIEEITKIHQLSPPSCGSSPSPWVSDVQSVRLSLSSCIMSVESL